MEAPVKRSPLAMGSAVGTPTGGGGATSMMVCSATADGTTTTSTGGAATTAASSMPDDGLSAAVKRFASLLGTKGQVGASTSSSRSSRNSSSVSQQQQLVQMFARATQPNDVVLVVPSLDLKLGGAGGAGGGECGSGDENSSTGSGNNNNNNNSKHHQQSAVDRVLPGVGQHAAATTTTTATSGSLLEQATMAASSATSTEPTTTTNNMNNTLAMNSSSLTAASASAIKERPTMEASVISMAAPIGDHHHDHAIGGGSATGAADAAAEASARQAADSIGQQTCWTRSTVCYAAQAVASNLSDSFATLVNSRLRAWTLLLLKHSLKSSSPSSSSSASASSHPSQQLPHGSGGDDAAARSRLLNMLSARIAVQGTAETNYRTLPLPESAAAGKPRNADVILPLLLEVVLHVQVQDRDEAVTLRAPGTVTASFAGETAASGLKQVQLRVDTGVLLKSMIDQARIVVLKAVAIATNTSVKDLPSITGKKEEEKEKPVVAATTEALGSFRSALKLPRSEIDPRLQKARTSAVRLNRVLHGKHTKVPMPGPGMRKARSVTVKWDHPGQTPRLNATLAPTPKKQNRNDAASLLTSYKSFGRPHAGDFGSGPRNATFGDYGRGVSAGLWGREGRLAAHPTPFQEAAVDPTTGDLRGGSMDRNATFGGSNSHSASAAAGAALLLAGQSTSTSQLNGGLAGLRASSVFGSSPSVATLPRTATALENSLMKNIGGSKW